MRNMLENLLKVCYTLKWRKNDRGKYVEQKRTVQGVE